MGKRTRRALMGFAAGALKGVSDFYRTKAMEEAQTLREERLAAIRAQERGEDRAFQRENIQLQNESQAQRDERLAAQRAAELEAQGEQRMGELKFSAEQQRELESIRGGNQIAAANASRADSKASEIIVRDRTTNKIMSMPIDDPRLRSGGDFEMVEGRAGTRFSGIPEVADPAASPAAAATVGGASSKQYLPDWVYVDGKLVPNPAKQ